jgi:hypothetical protein
MYRLSTVQVLIKYRQLVVASCWLPVTGGGMNLWLVNPPFLETGSWNTRCQLLVASCLMGQPVVSNPSVTGDWSLATAYAVLRNTLRTSFVQDPRRIPAGNGLLTAFCFD